MNKASACCAILISLAPVSTMAAEEPVFEDLGAPITIRTLPILAVTPKADGGHLAWGWRRPQGLVGIDISNGKCVHLDMRPNGKANCLAIARGPDGGLFFYSGSPGRFFKYTPQGKLEELAVLAKPAAYWIQECVSRDNIFYVGTYPDATLVACDMNNGKTTSLGRMTDDEREKYILFVAAADDGIIYCSVGLHHRELWSLDPKTGKHIQILPKSMTTEQGAPTIWTGTDGKVYGRDDGIEYLCRTDKVEMGKTCPPRLDATAMRAADQNVVSVDEQGRLKLAAVSGGATSEVQTDYPGRSLGVYSVGCQHDGKIHGGTIFPGRAFTYDPKTSRFDEIEAATPGTIQIYDTFSHPKGLFFASYDPCLLDFFNPDAPRAAGENPRRLKASIPGQERPVQWEQGPDGGLYFGTIPAKGRLGGALVRVDPADFGVRVWQNILPDQSIQYVASVPETGELFGCASVKGGSSAIPSLHEAEVFLWDTKTEKVVWRGKPLPGTHSYLRTIRHPGGLIVGVTEQSWFLFDPIKRQVLYTADLPIRKLCFPCLSDRPVGTDGLMIGIGGGAVFAINPLRRNVRVLAQHDSLGKAQGFLVTEDGQLYYGSGDHLWRSRLELR